MKLNPDILQKVRSVEIHTRRLLSGTLIGDHSSAKKGFGLDFDQLRDYQVGDDVRHIDWNSTARSDRTLVREYTEERNRTIMLVVDGSASMKYGSSDELKSDIAAQVGSVLALVADYSRDNVGMVLVGNNTKQVVPPKRGRAHVHYIMETLFMHQPKGKVSLEKGLADVLRMNRKDMIVFVISDFLTAGYESVLKMISKRHETILIHCFDPLEVALPNCGLLPIQDPETGDMIVISTGSKELNHFLKKQQYDIEDLCKRSKVERLSLQIDQPFIGQLIRFFRMRMLT